MCRRRCCGDLWYNPSCPVCRFLAGTVRLLDWRGNVCIVPMTKDHELHVRDKNRGLLSPAFLGDEGTFITGYWRVSRRLFAELFAPAFLLRRWFGSPKSAQSPTDAPA